jgi:hypothetical protein
MEGIGGIDWRYRLKARSVDSMEHKSEEDGSAILYGSDDSRDSRAMVGILQELGVAFEYRAVNRDPVALREWEQLDGECVPVLRIGHDAIVRGLDRIRVQQLAGWVGD